MACAGSRSLDLTYLKQFYTAALSYSNTALTQQINAWHHWEDNEDHLAIQDLCYSLSNLIASVQMIIGKFTPFYPEYGVIHFLEHHTVENGVVDMDAILTAMMDAKVGQYTHFIGMVDAYRTNLWNEPFLIEYYAELVRHFTR